MYSGDNFGFLLRLVDETPSNALLFCSIDVADSTKHPTLEVCYATESGIFGNEKDVEELSIFPNPSTGGISVKIPSNFHNENNTVLEVYTISGVRVQSIQVSRDRVSIDLSNLQPGFYLVKVISNKGIAIGRIELITQ